MKNKENLSILENDTLSRKEFLIQAGTAVTGTFLITAIPSGCISKQQESRILEISARERKKILASDGYLIVDPKKCQGCLSCMMACSLAHEGEINLSLSRIQILQDSFGKYPDDISVNQCRQCVDPECVKACPTGALHIDKKNGNVRRVDEKKCIGCEACIEACPFTPGRAVWNHETKRSIKCDLCADTPYRDEKGGPGGKQACVEVCPVGAIKFSRDIPVQEGDRGYCVNLRGEGWKKIGYPVD